MGVEAGDNDARYRDLVEGSLEGIAVVDKDNRILYANQAHADIHGHASVSELMQLADGNSLIASEDLARIDQNRRRRLAGQPVPASFRYRGRRRDGALVWLNGLSRTIEWHGQAAVQVAVTDISQQVEAEAALRRSERRYRELIESALLGIVIFDINARPLFANQAAADLFGYTSAGKITALTSIASLSAEQDQRQRLDYQVRRLAGEELPPLFEFQGRDQDQELIWLQCHIQIVDWDGTPAIQATLVDISQQKKMQAALDEADAQLRQSQKMETVGQLTGGVAHDFNNLLAVIAGNMEMLDEALSDQSELRSLSRRAIGAVQRGAELTHRLLAFSRRQPLSPQPTDVNNLIQDMGEMLRRTLGATIDVRTVSRDDLWPCEIDPAQMQNVLLNLAVNARDAMPKGGHLTFETANRRIDGGNVLHPDDPAPGEYITVSATDSGHGMTEEVRQKAFEPFFTTKDIGQGSGLGLSMTYGFARQSGGWATIYSEAGMGTTVRLYLPRRLQDGDVRTLEDSFSPIPRGRGETILVVEDDRDVRDLAVAQLTSLHYRVIEATDGAEALRLLADHHEINLILSDIVMPGGISGPELKQELERGGRTLPVLFMSGYPERAMEQQGQLAEGDYLLQKPFRMEDLARRVRMMLDKTE